MSPSALSPMTLFAGPLERAVERFLALSPRHRELLAPLTGKHIRLNLQHPDLTVHLIPTERSVQIHDGLDDSADVTLTGSWIAFARMKLSDEPQRSLFGGDIRIDGDIKLARNFQDLMDRLDIDWEAQFAGQIGAGPAAHLFDLLSAGRQWMSDLRNSLEQDCAEYLQEESRELPAASETDRFFRAVDEIRADADRLEARIERLNKALGQQP